MNAFSLRDFVFQCLKKNEDRKWWVGRQLHKQIICDKPAGTEPAFWVSPPILCDKKQWANTSPLCLENSRKQPFLPWELSQPFIFFFFLAVPKTKILATGGASHNRDILQVSAGRASVTRRSVTSKSQTLPTSDPIPLPGRQSNCLPAHAVSRLF